MQILLVRHGQSRGNVDKSHYLEVADHDVALSEEGFEQADGNGAFLADWIPKHWGQEPVRVWHSPYRRASQTTDRIVAAMGDLVLDRREHILLAEQQFGLFDGLDNAETAVRYPDEHAHYERCRAHGGRFWARMPLGESRFDVAQRVHQSFGTFQRDAARHDLNRLVIVCHGTTVRAFMMMWLGLGVEWFENESNPPNASVRYLNGDRDDGYVFPGFA